MEKATHSERDQPPSDKWSFEPLPENGVCERLGDKWTVQVIYRLAAARDHRLRFSALKGQVEGITQRMLTLTLRNLERDGLLLRHYFPEAPPGWNMS